MMESVETNICRTCLGPLAEAPRNLFDEQFADILELLRGFLSSLVDLQSEGTLNVCSLCYDKLDYICKFREQCQNSFKNYMEIKNKKDPVISNLGQIFDDDYLATKINLNSENLDETITIYKNNDETNCSDTAVEAALTAKAQIPTTSNAKRGSRAKQFPIQDVITAVDECTSYQTALEKRKCIHCDYLTKTNRQLCIHMKSKHIDELRTWCSRCNAQTIDLEEHTKAVQCCEYVCKFCNKKCRRLFMLMAHLKSHASEHFTILAKKTKNTAHETPQVSQELDTSQTAHQQENSLQQLSNVVFDEFSTNQTALAIAINNTQVATVQIDPILIASVTHNNQENKSTNINNTTQAQQLTTSDGKIKVSRVSKQYDSALVLQALAECTNYMKDMKNRTCRHCNIVTSTASGLNSHMSRAHAELYPFWCNRCNIQTEDLPAHRELIKCNMFKCKFCEKAFNKLNKLTKHIQCHCHEIFRNKPTTVEEEPTVQLQAMTSASNDHQHSGDSISALENTDGNITYENSQEFQFFTSDVNMPYQQQNSRRNESSDGIVADEPAVVKMNDSFAENTDGTGMTFESTDNTDGNITYESLSNMNAKMAYESFAADADDMKYEEQEVKNEDRGKFLSDLTESCRMDKLKEALKAEDSFLSYATNSNDSNINNSMSDTEGNTDDLDNCGEDPESSMDTSASAHLEQVNPNEVVRALTAAHRPLLVHNVCTMCKSVLTDNRGLSLHMTVVHKEEKRKWCRTCNGLFDNIDRHREIHALKCEFCNKTFMFLSHLQSHLKNHARNHKFNLSVWLTCKTCSNSFPSQDLLNTHKCMPDPSKVDHKKCRAYCEICHEAVPVLKNHMKEKHNTDGASKFNLCSVCGQSFTSTYQLNVHMRKHAGDLPHKCSHCDKCFAAKHLLNIHEKQHTDEKQNICHICSKAFATGSQLDNHVQTHTGKPLKCTQCDKTFTFKAHLTVHMRQHTGEKPHMCTFADCNRSFANKAALASHTRQTHNEDRPFKCGYCELMFKVKATMQNHEFIHTGIKPYKCTECPYSCRQSRRLTQHMKQHEQHPHQPQQHEQHPHQPQQQQQQQEETKSAHTCVFCQEQFPTHLQLITHTYATHGEMPMAGIATPRGAMVVGLNANAAHVNTVHAQQSQTAVTTPNVVNITSHHIILQDGNSAQTIQIAGLDMSQPMDTSRVADAGGLPQLTPLVSMETSSTMGTSTTVGSVDSSTAMDDIDQVPIQIVYKPVGLG